MKKWILIIFAVIVVVGTFIGMGKFRSEEEMAIELSKIAQKEKEEMMHFKLNDTNKENYNLVKTTKVKELNMDIVELEHKVTKCKIVLMVCDDEERAFNIAFRTLPTNNSGIAHIMEHSVLSGSKKYNIKSPVFNMIKTSMATFLNAMTGVDTTSYPFSSANEKDFKNLMDVYLDAVFFPNIYTNNNILRQEGWHYEIENEDDELKVSGVVLSEMKGANSVPTDVLQRAILRDVYNGMPYQYNFAGESKEIIDITQEDFEDFHKMYYSPSNAVVYLYGLLDMNERLEYMQNEYLSKFDYVNVDLPKFDIKNMQCKSGVYYYDGDVKDKNKSYISYNFVFNDDKDNLKDIVSNILNYILFGKQGSLIKDKLVKAGFGEDVSCIYEKSLENGYASIIAENIDSAKKDDFIKAVDDAIKNIVENGIDENILRASINSLYLRYAENDPGSYTRGLSYSLKSMDSYNYGYGVDNFIKYQDAFDAINNEDLSSVDNIFIKRLRELYIDNKYKCVTVLSPQVDVIKNEEKELADILKKRKKEMVDNDTIGEAIQSYEDFKYFANSTDSKEELAKMPKLDIDDIERDRVIINSEEKDIYGKKVYTTFENTGGIVYVGIDFMIPKRDEDFPDSEKYFLSVATDLLGTLDTENYTFEQLDTEFDTYTAGCFSTLLLNEDNPILRVYTKTKIENIDKAYELLNEAMFKTKFDDSRRIKQKLAELKIRSNDEISDYQQAANLYRAGAKLSYRYELVDKMSYGSVAYDMFINDFVKAYGNKANEINKGLAQVWSKYVNYDKMMLDCCMEEKNYERYEESTRDFLKAAVVLDKDDKNEEPKINNILEYETYNRKYTMEAFVTNSNVNFVSRALNYDKNLYNGHLMVLQNIVNYDYLHEKVRVEGGAYGAGMAVSKGGTIVFYSFSDPKFTETDDIYKDIGNFIKNVNMSKEDLDANIIGTMKRIDTFDIPKDKHSRNFSYYLTGIDNDELNKLRHEILDTTVEDFPIYVDVFKNISNNSEFCALITAQNETKARSVYKIVKKLKK